MLWRDDGAETIQRRERGGREERKEKRGRLVMGKKKKLSNETKICLGK